jgi:hypothetical protein
MINTRMLAIAAALSLLLPLGATADPQSTIVQAEARVEAIVTNIQLLQPQLSPAPINGTLVGEQVVEGHTTFVTLDAVEKAKPVTGNITLQGFVQCTDYGNATYSWITVFGHPIPYPTRVDDVHVRCSVGQTVIVTPSVYCEIDGPPKCGSNDPPALRPDGDVLPFQGPQGEDEYAVEYSFTKLADDGQGGSTERTYYAWATPILDPFVGEDGLARNMVLPIPEERLGEMPDVDHFRILYGDAVHAQG